MLGIRKIIEIEIGNKFLFILGANVFLIHQNEKIVYIQNLILFFNMISFLEIFRLLYATNLSSLAWRIPFVIQKPTLINAILKKE